MGMLVEGEWKVQEVNPETKDGEFHRQKQKYHSSLGKEYPKEKGRYHLYVSYACPWAHRSLIMRQLKGLEDFISYSVVSPDMMDEGWSFDNSFSGSTGDQIYNLSFLKDLYTKADNKFTGRVTVPVLWDKQTDSIVNNESSEIIRIFNSLNEFSSNQEDYYPESYKDEIDEVNDDVYNNINNGVYKTGFARNQKAYEKNFMNLFDSLERQEKRLEGKLYLVGENLTEADIRLFTTLIRFDAVYFTHFKCNKRMIKDYPNLNRYLKNLYSLDAFRRTTNFNHIKRHYYYSHRTLNPFGIVPLGPSLDSLTD